MPTKEQVIELVENMPEIKDIMQDWYPDYFELSFDELRPMKVYQIISAPVSAYINDYVMLVSAKNYALLTCELSNWSDNDGYTYSEAVQCKFKEVQL